MEVLFILEEKIKMLASLTKNLKQENDALTKENSVVKEENESLKAENARLAENNAHISVQLKSIEDSMLKETGYVIELKEERIVTKSVLDDLIKSIDSIVENEN